MKSCNAAGVALNINLLNVLIFSCVIYNMKTVIIRDVKNVITKTQKEGIKTNSFINHVYRQLIFIEISFEHIGPNLLQNYNCLLISLLTKSGISCNAL